MHILDKTILVTGANRGIGEALVTEALRRGAKKVFAGTRGDAVTYSDKRVTPLTLDVTSASDIRRAVNEVGSLDVLINNAGIAIYDDLSDPAVIEQHFVRAAQGNPGILAAPEARQRGSSQQPVARRTECAADPALLLHFEGCNIQPHTVVESTPGWRRRQCPCRRTRPNRYRHEPRPCNPKGFSCFRCARHFRRP
jgi:hypothetical protein